MKVMLDISFLALQYGRYCSTGIGRITENLLIGLAGSRECDLSVSSVASLPLSVTALRYLKNHPDGLPEIPFVGPVKKARIFALLDEWLKKTGLQRASRFLNRYGRGLSLHHFKGFEIFHSSYLPFPPLIKKVPHLKRVLNIYDLFPFTSPPRFGYSKGEREGYRSMLESVGESDWVICHSHFVKSQICNHLKKVRPERIFVIPPGASEAFEKKPEGEEINALRNKYGIPEGPYILSVGSFVIRKNIPHLIRCFRKLKEEERPDSLSLVLAGYGSLSFDPGLPSLLEGEPGISSIIVLQNISDEDLIALYHGALFFASISLQEGFGFPALEAMRCGLPVLTSNTTSVPEVVGDAAITIDPDDSEELCHELGNLYRSPSLRQTLSQKSRERAKQFTWNRFVGQSLTAYKTILNESPF